jgi:hypothetical protein
LGVNKHADPTKIDAGIHMLLRRKPDERTLRDVGGHIRNSTKRMAALIDDMLDLAKGRIGGGFSLDRNPDAPLYEHLEQVIGELRDVSENRIEANIAMVPPVNCDPKRIAQLTRLSCDSFFSHYFAERAGRGLGLYIAAMRARMAAGSTLPLRKRKPYLRCEFPARNVQKRIAAFIPGYPPGKKRRYATSHNGTPNRRSYWRSTLACCLRSFTGSSIVSEVDRLRMRISRFRTSRFSTTRISSSTGMMVTPFSVLIRGAGPLTV